MNEGTEQRERAMARNHLQAGIEQARYIQLERWYGGFWAAVVCVCPPTEAQPDPRLASVEYVHYGRYGESRRLYSARLWEVRRFAGQLPEDAGTVYDLDRRIDFGRALIWPTPANAQTPYVDEYHPAYVEKTCRLNALEAPRIMVKPA